MEEPMAHECDYRQPTGDVAGGVSPSDVQEAEEAFYEAMALHGHNSAEAFVANHIWAELRKRAANGTSHG